MVYMVGGIQSVQGAITHWNKPGENNNRRPGDVSHWQAAVKENQRFNRYYHPPFGPVLDKAMAALQSQSNHTVSK